MNADEKMNHQGHEGHTGKRVKPSSLSPHPSEGRDGCSGPLLRPRLSGLGIIGARLLTRALIERKVGGFALTARGRIALAKLG
jgi:hypothetical protein